MRPEQPAQPTQAEIDRAATVLLCLVDWNTRFDAATACKALQEAKLDAAVDTSVSGGPRVHRTVIAAFIAKGRGSIVRDVGQDCWRQRRKDDPK